MDSCCNKIMEGIRALDVDDDGIKSNQKYKYILGLFQKECTSAKHLRDIYVKLNEQSLKENAFAVNLALLGSCRLFQTTEIFGNKTQTLMMNLMKENYLKLDEMKDGNINEFYNSLTLFSEFWSRARTDEGGSIVFLVKPLIEYLKVLLELNTERSAKEFTTHIIMNGEKMAKSHSNEVTDLMNSVREKVCSDDIESKSVRIWLMFSIEYSHNNFRCVELRVEQCYNKMLKKVCKDEDKEDETEDKIKVVEEEKKKKPETPTKEITKDEDSNEKQQDPIVVEKVIKETTTTPEPRSFGPPIRSSTTTTTEINKDETTTRPPTTANNDIDAQKLVKNLCQNIAKCAVVNDWSPSTRNSNAAIRRSLSSGKITPPKGNNDCDESDNTAFINRNRRNKSPGSGGGNQRFQVNNHSNYNNHNNHPGGGGNQDTFKPKSGGILSPRERLRAQMAAKKQDFINDTNNETQKKNKNIKSYLKDEYVENLTWNNVDVEQQHRDYYPERRNDISPKFINFLQRN